MDFKIRWTENGGGECRLRNTRTANPEGLGDMIIEILETGGERIVIEAEGVRVIGKMGEE